MKNSIKTLLISMLFLANISHGLGQQFSMSSIYIIPATLNNDIDTNENEAAIMYMIKSNLNTINNNESNPDIIKHPDSTDISDSSVNTSESDNNWGEISGENLNGNNQIHWTIEKENDIDYFAIEISTNGKEFVEIANLKGNESNLISNQFLYIHKQAVAPLTYYRIKQVDFKGKTTYSKILKMTANSANINSIMVYPNPVNSTADISVNFSENSTYILSISDANGKMVVTQAGSAGKGINNIPLDMNGQKSGVYIIYMTGANGISHVSKFIKE